MTDYYEGKVAVVTGGAGGIGLALGENLLEAGAGLVVLADIDEQNLRAETARLNAMRPGAVLGVPCDVTAEADVAALVAAAAEAGKGRIDLLINNAGAGLQGQFDELSDQDWQRAFNLNFYSALWATRAVVPIMRAQGGGQIVNVISGIAFWPMAFQSMYTATKAALNALSLALRYELWDDGIRVSSATPGNTITGIWKGKQPPPGSVTAAEAAARILDGASQNQRLILGASDVDGVKVCFDPDYSEGNDTYLLDIARRRRAGEWAV